MAKSLINDFSKESALKIEYKLVPSENFKRTLCVQGITQLDVDNRLYMTTRERPEINFIKFALYDKAKFLPIF